MIVAHGDDRTLFFAHADSMTLLSVACGYVILMDLAPGSFQNIILIISRWICLWLWYVDRLCLWHFSTSDPLPKVHLVFKYIFRGLQNHNKSPNILDFGRLSADGLLECLVSDFLVQSFVNHDNRCGSFGLKLIKKTVTVNPCNT